MKMIIIKISVVFSFALMIFINFIANTKSIGGVTTGEISAKYNTLFTPSGFTFSIWGLIYVLLFIFVIVFSISTENTIPNMKLLGILFITTCVFNLTWLLSWHYDKILLSTIIMILFLLTLLSILRFTEPKGITYVSFSIYSGWVSIALIANISILLFKYDLTLFMSNQSLWLYIVLGISLIIGGYMIIVQKNYYYSAVFLWAYIGIVSKFIR